MKILGRFACDGGLSKLDIWPSGGAANGKSQKADRSKRFDRSITLIFAVLFDLDTTLGPKKKSKGIRGINVSKKKKKKRKKKTVCPIPKRFASA